MIRPLIITALVAAASFFSATGASASCGKQACPTHYGRYTAREAFVLFQQHPELIQRFPQIAQQLETQFGAIRPVAVTTPATAPAVSIPADSNPPVPVSGVAAPPAPASLALPPAVAPVQPGVTVETPPVANPTPVAPNEQQVPSAVDPSPALSSVQTPEQDIAPVEADSNALGFPDDLPLADAPDDV
ncbi:MAG: hypothetical protein KF861_14560 [Planctomycetaceae bacterium]|nr:hypothetical protein [Planctomycetaceae bacterium]